MVFQHALQVSRPTLRGELEGSGRGGSPGPHSGGKLRGLAWGGVSRPTPRREVEGSGGGFQAHTYRGLQAHTRGSLQAHTWEVGIPACIETDPLPADGYCRGRYASYWNAFLFYIFCATNGNMPMCKTS